MNNMYIQPKKINNAEFAPKQEINLDIQPKKNKRQSTAIAIQGFKNINNSI